MVESTAIITGRQSLWLEKTRRSPNIAATDTKTKEKKLLTFKKKKKPQVTRDLKQESFTSTANT